MISDRTRSILRRLRIQYRADPAVYRDLLIITDLITSLESATDLGETDSRNPPLMLTTADAADLAGITPDAIRRAIRRGRLAATRHGGTWLITRPGFAEWNARRRGTAA